MKSVVGKGYGGVCDNMYLFEWSWQHEDFIEEDGLTWLRPLRRLVEQRQKV